MLKSWLRLYAVHLLSLWITTLVISGFIITGSMQTFLVAGLVFWALRIFIHPILKILLLPINLLTANIMAWLLHLLTLYVLVALIPQITITAFTLPSYQIGSLTTPSYHLTAFMTALSSAFILNFVTRILNWFLN